MLPVTYTLEKPFDYLIRAVTPSGIITIFAGDGTLGTLGDGGPATAAELQNPNPGLTDASGKIYLICAGKIRKIDPIGGITTFAGTGVYGYMGDGGPATAAQFKINNGMGIDKIGNIYVADMQNERIRKIDTSGIITTIAGTGVENYFGDGGPATAAEFNYPSDVKLDPAGNIYIADLANHRIRKIDHSTGIITTVVGNGTPGFSGDGGPATAAQFIGGFMAFDCSGNLYIRDDGNNRIRKVTFRHPPHFMNGQTQGITACEGTPHSIDSALAVIDSDAGLTDIWSVVLLPTHGTLAAGYSTTTTGDTLTPSGLSYTPSAGYTGYDTFKVILANCNDVKDSTTIYVHILPAITTSISGPDSVCVGQTITLSEASSGGAWNAGNAKATVSAGIVSGIAPGIDTIWYSVSNSCGADTVSHTVAVKLCPSLVGQLNGLQTEIKLYPNPANSVLTIAATDNITSIIITDLLGQRVYDNYFHSEQVQLNIATLPPGMYFVKVNNIYTRKLVKE